MCVKYVMKRLVMPINVQVVKGMSTYFAVNLWRKKKKAMDRKLFVHFV